MRWVCIICEADKRKNRDDNIVFKHQYLEVKRCLRYFVAASSAPNEDGLLGAKHKCSEGNPYVFHSPTISQVPGSGRSGYYYVR